jgi:glycosyltransferase 2 family protein
MALAMNVRRFLQLGITLIIGAVCLWLALRGMQNGTTTTADVWAAMSSMPWWSHATFIALTVVQMALRTERWRIQARGISEQTPPLRASLAINGIGFAAVFFLPFRLGEFVRPNLGAQRGIMPASAGLAVSAVERVVDGLVMTVMFGVVLLALGDAALPSEVKWGGVLSLAVFGGATVFFIVAWRARALALSIIEGVVGLLSASLAKRVSMLAATFIDGFACFKGGKDLVTYVVITILYWLLNAGAMWVLLLPLWPEASWTFPVLTLCFLVLGMMMPAPPGNVGNFHAFCRMGLSAVGVAAAPAIAYAVVLHALTSLTCAGFGVAMALVGGVTLRGATTASVNATPPVP